MYETKKLTQEKLKIWLNYDITTGLFTWLKNKGARARSGQTTNGKSPFRYHRITIDGETYPAHVLVWLYVYGEFPTSFIDHIDCNKSNNRLSNLRLATKSENSFNTPLRRTNTSGFKGVTWSEKDKKWRAQATIDGKNHYLGDYKTKQEASDAYNAFCREKHKEFFKDTINE